MRWVQSKVCHGVSMRLYVGSERSCRAALIPKDGLVILMLPIDEGCGDIPYADRRAGRSVFWVFDTSSNEVLFSVAHQC